MASINPILKSKTATSTIYVRLRSGRKHDHTVSTGLTINYKYWNKKTKRPKETDPDLKNLKSDLDDLVSFIQSSLNEITRQGLEPSKKWLENIINIHFNKETKEQNAGISYWINYIINNPLLFENSVGQKGLSFNRIKQLKTLLTVFNRYQGKHKHKVIEIDQLFYDKFCHWLKNEEDYSQNTTKKFVDDILAVGRHARRHKIPASMELDLIKRIRLKKIRPIIIEEDELKRIINVKLTKNHLINTRKWLLLGLQIAQRVSDLLDLCENNIQYLTNLDNELVKCIVFNQKKSQYTKEIIIPIDQSIEEIIKDGFPTKLSSQKFNDYIKEVCKIAKIDKLTDGSVPKIVEVNGKRLIRKIEGIYPKYELITSHTMRKTATTHYYQIFGSKVMHITGHSKEETVNLYVNDDRSRKVSQVQELRRQYTEFKGSKKEKDFRLDVVKKLS